jgi:hypothetical protein
LPNPRPEDAPAGEAVLAPDRSQRGLDDPGRLARPVKEFNS